MIDIHTHHFNSSEEAIHSVIPFSGFIPHMDRWYSIGIHPWKINEFLEGKICTKNEFEQLAMHSHVVAIGEAGLDKAHYTASKNKFDNISLYEESVELFKWQAILAEEVEKPLIIHCVHAMEDMIRIKKEISPTQLWIIHGFRGKLQQATQFIRHGFALSFGEYFNSEAVSMIPASLLFAETDESNRSISEIVYSLAKARNEDLEVFKCSLKRNVSRSFKLYS